MSTEDKTYTLFWRTGDSEIVTGRTAAEAMTLAGYSGGAVGALDFHGEGNLREKYKWNAESREWDTQ